MYPHQHTETCSNSSMPIYNIVTCIRVRKKPKILLVLQPLPTERILCSKNFHVIQKDLYSNFCSVYLPHTIQGHIINQCNELCEGYCYHTKNYYIMHLNSSSTFKFSNQKNTIRDNQHLQLHFDTKLVPDLSITLCIVNNKGGQQCEELIRRDRE